MIEDDVLDALPEDPELAFVHIEKAIRQTITQKVEESEDNSNAIPYYYHEYINKIVAAAKALGISEIASFEVPDRGNNIWQEYDRITAVVDAYVMQVRIRMARRVNKFSVQLDEPARLKIRNWLEKIKEFVGSLDIADEKKEALYARIRDLESEVNRERTKLDAVGAFWVSLCAWFGEGVEKLEPARKWVDSIGNVLGNAKRPEGPGRLPAPKEPKQLPPPKQERRQSRDLDDDIPF